MATPRASQQPTHSPDPDLLRRVRESQERLRADKAKHAQAEQQHRPAAPEAAAPGAAAPRRAQQENSVGAHSRDESLGGLRRAEAAPTAAEPRRFGKMSSRCGQLIGTQPAGPVRTHFFRTQGDGAAAAAAAAGSADGDPESSSEDEEEDTSGSKRGGGGFKQAGGGFKQAGGAIQKQNRNSKDGGRGVTTGGSKQPQSSGGTKGGAAGGRAGGVGSQAMDVLLPAHPTPALDATDQAGAGAGASSPGVAGAGAGALKRKRHPAQPKVRGTRLFTCLCSGIEYG